MRIAVGAAAISRMAASATMTAASAGAVSMMYCVSSADLATTAMPVRCCGHTCHRSGASFHRAQAVSSPRTAVVVVWLCAI